MMGNIMSESIKGPKKYPSVLLKDTVWEKGIYSAVCKYLYSDNNAGILHLCTKYIVFMTTLVEL